MEVPSRPRRQAAPARFVLFLHALAFVLGFSTVFVALGMATAGLGGLLDMVAGSVEILTRLGGLLIIGFGLFTIGLIDIPFLNYDTRRPFTGWGSLGLLSSYMMGVFFSAGWTPCHGPILGAILTLVLREGGLLGGSLLLVGYSLGLGIPFLLTGLALDRATLLLRKLHRHLAVVKFVTGGLLVLVGVMVLVDAFHLSVPLWMPTFRNLKIWAVQSSLQQSLLDVEAGMRTTAVPPTFFVAMLAGLLSFLSPCVLPLVPAYIGYLGGHAVRQVEQRAG